jgi:putative proteasome-type protease
VSSGRELLTARKVARTRVRASRSSYELGAAIPSRQSAAVFRGSVAKQTGARERLYKAVDLYAAQVRRLYSEEGKVLLESDLRFNVHALIGGQMVADTSHRLFMVTPRATGWRSGRYSVSDHR